MIEKKLTGNEAIAYGILDADARAISGYPGSPITTIIPDIIKLEKNQEDRHIEWSVNEKVALEVALGASLGGDRALVCLKSVGFNITVDPVMTANLTGVNAGLVVLLGDDPGAWLSQNEQDTRKLVEFMELPILEPSSPQEARDMVLAAFELSERFETIVVVRQIRSLSTAEGMVKLQEKIEKHDSKGYQRIKNRWISTTFNVIENHKKLHKKLDEMSQLFNKSPFNKAVIRDSRIGVIAAGYTCTRLTNIPGSDKLSILKLGTTNPLPGELIVDFLKASQTIVVLEDNEPYVEEKIKTIAHDAKVDIKILGKMSGHLPREGELTEDNISPALKGHIYVDTGKGEVSSETSKTFCDDCPYTSAFEILSDVMGKMDDEIVIIAEPGCGVKLNAPPFEMLDIKYSMGSAIGIASGLARSRSGIKPIAVCGDSSFFHTGINGLMNVINNPVNIFILVLDNAYTALTGRQTHPGTGKDARGRKTKTVDITSIARVSGIESVEVIDPDDTEVTRKAFYKALTSEETSIVVVRKPCPLAQEE
ncbi:hypothetical protein GF312_05490 [Candidatus Poribacteria bacterium]|nr:hypothetical protein [Candidatus Poribacteria bacterium]